MGQQLFNVCDYLLDQRLVAGDGDRTALTGVAGELTYAGLHDLVSRAAAGLRAAGVEPEHRVLMLMADTPEFVTLWLATMRIGAIPIPVSTMLRADNVAEMLRDSRARFMCVSHEFAAAAEGAAAQAPDLRAVVADAPVSVRLPVHLIDELTQSAPDDRMYDSTGDSPAFWAYTSGTTGLPKAAMHRHESVKVTCETYGTQVLGIRPDDRCLSAAKVFFTYGLGPSVMFPMSVGASAILNPVPSRPDIITEAAVKYGATIFAAGPTFFANMLRAGMPSDALGGVRLATSAGEALPASLYERWSSHFGINIIDGIGMTEMLHIFLSNSPDDVRPGTTGKAVPGYDLKLIDEETGEEVGNDTPATLYVRGATAATGYWSRYDATRQVFQGDWVRTGDTYVKDADGYYACLGRTGDMIKASGIWVSPMEVEARLLTHPAVSQAVVVAAPDVDGLEKPVAYIILEPGAVAGQSVTEEELIEYCREGLPSFKRPRKVIFTDAFPITATGKIRRVDLRTISATVLLPGVS